MEVAWLQEVSKRKKHLGREVESQKSHNDVLVTEPGRRVFCCRDVGSPCDDARELLRDLANESCDVLWGKEKNCRRDAKPGKDPDVESKNYW